MPSTPMTDAATDAAAAVNDTDSAARAGLDELSYEQARDELIAVVAQLEQGGASLEDSLVLWERGEALADRCEEWLIGAKARLDAARAGAGPAAGVGENATAGTDAAAGATAGVGAGAAAGKSTDSLVAEAERE